MTARLAALLAALLAAQPVIDIDGVVSNASFAPACVANGGVAPGSLVAVFGRNLGPASGVQAAFPLRPDLNGVRARIDASGRSFDALPVYTSANQVGVLLPSAVPPGEGTLTLTYGSQATAPAPILVRPSAFGLFANGVQNVGPGGDLRLNGPAEPLRPGQLGFLWGTGLGAAPGDEATAPIPGDQPSRDIRVWFGGRAASVLYRGRSGCCAGVDQILFETPAGVEGCQVPVAMEVDGVLSNHITAAVTTRGPCPSVSRPPPAPYGSPNFRLGVIVFLDGFGSVLLPGAQDDWVRLGFFQRGALEADVEPTLQAFEPNEEAPPGPCYVRTGTAFPPQPRPQPSSLDAGPELRVSGPGGVFRLTQNPANPGNYEDERRVPLAPGRYVVEGGIPNGAVGPFSFETEAVSLRLTSTPATISRRRDLEVTWDWSGPADHRLTVFGSTGGACGRAPVSFTCQARAGDRRFVVPARVLALLPASTQIFGIPNGALNISTTAPGGTRRFVAAGLDQGLFVHVAISAARVAYE